MSRFVAYAVVSAALTYSTVNHAIATREYFYPAVIYLVTSKFSVVVLCNMAVVLIVLLAKVLKSLFLGDLRPQEVEVCPNRPRARERPQRADVPSSRPRSA
jgi:E3 ubiquitin-protein ligase synoviolin